MNVHSPSTHIVMPYPGLRPFESHEAEIFFGRSAQIDGMLAKLEAHRFLAVVGASGCGKSSLVRAGLLPALQEGFLEGGVTDWRMLIMRPAGGPFAQLAQASHDAMDARPSPPEEVAFTETTLRRSPRGLVDAIAESATPAETHYLLLVDQFEELFRFRYREVMDQSTEAGRAVYEARNEATAFVNLLLATAQQTAFPVYVVMTMRSDFMGDCDAFRGLPEAINEGQFLAPRLTRAQLQEAIGGPLQMFQGEAEPALVTAILNDVGNDPDQLPLMQHALMRTWLRVQERAAGSGQERLVVTREDYLAIGGLKEALSRHADEAYAELHTEAKQRVAEIMFRCLADAGPQKQIVRRITTVDEIRQVADTDLPTVIDVAQTFLRPDRSFLKTQRLEDIRADSTLDVSHEALLRHWGKVQTWLEDEAEAKHTFLRLAETARLWESHQASVLRSPELDLALQWEVRQKPTVAWAQRYEGDLPLCLKFLRASQWASTREKRLTRGIIAAAFIMISLFAVIGFLLWKQAKTSAEEARQHATRALELSATSQHEEGKAWLERALLHQDHRDFFAASMMAARAVGFDGYGRQSQNARFAETFPVLLQPHHPEYQEVQALLRRTSAAFRPTWQSPIARHHQAGVSSVAFSPDGRSLASGSRDKTIKLWDVEYVVNFRPDLTGYLASDWCTLDGRKLLWTNTTDNLYKSRAFEYVNVPPFSHIGILRRNLPPPELENTLFWHSLHANNWDSAMVLYERLTIPEAQESAREALIVQLTRAAQTAFDAHVNALAQRRLEQARVLVKPEETNRRVLEMLKQLATLEQAMSK